MGNPDPIKAPTKVTPSSSAPKRYEASIFCSGKEPPAVFAEGILKLEALIGRPLWTIVQRGPGDSHSEINDELVDALIASKAELKGQEKSLYY